MTPVDPKLEIKRIVAEYDRRGRFLDPRRYSPTRAGNALAISERQQVLGAALARRGRANVALMDILEVGCGTGGELALLVAAGADPTRLAGIDLRPDAVDKAQERVPQAKLAVGDARSLPYEDRSFDLVYQATALSSMPSASMRSVVAAEMVRVTRLGGLIVSYDFAWNPTNRETVGITVNELRRLFPNMSIEIHRVTLVPPVARSVGDRSTRALNLLAAIPVLHTHRLAIVDVPH
jgi:ubiquinone/menaquinone biosynthesis C-methylase UbiE